MIREANRENRSLKLADVEQSVSVDNESTIVDWQSGLRMAAFDAITEDDVKQIVANQVKKAKEGDPNAIKFVMGTVLGSNKPVTIKQTQIITDVATAARIARGEK